MADDANLGNLLTAKKPATRRLIALGHGGLSANLEELNNNL